MLIQLFIEIAIKEVKIIIVTIIFFRVKTLNFNIMFCLGKEINKYIFFYSFLGKPVGYKFLYFFFLHKDSWIFLLLIYANARELIEVFVC